MNSEIKCPACESGKVDRLPPNDITKNPGWVCASCGLQMRYSKKAAMYWGIIALCGTIALFLVGVLALIALGPIFSADFETPDDRGKMVAFGIGITGVCLYVGRWALVEAKKPAPKFE